MVEKGPTLDRSFDYPLPPAIRRTCGAHSRRASLRWSEASTEYISTRAYQKAGLNTYYASNSGSLSIRVDFKATANGYEVNGARASTVRIQGPDTDLAKDSSNCNDSKRLDVRHPGNYPVTVTAHQDSGAEHEDGIDVTVLPG